MKITLFFMFVICTYVHVCSQNPVVKYQTSQAYSIDSTALNNEVKSYYENYALALTPEFDGTYQFIINSPQKLLVSTETIDLINSNRQSRDEIILELNSFTKIRILPTKEIRKKNFQPLVDIFILNF